MAVKGAQLKAEITQKILAAFPGSFLYNDGKEIRINGMENGELIQIKVALTASKTPVGDAAGDTTIPEVVLAPTSEKIPNEPSEEEKERLKQLLANLGL